MTSRRVLHQLLVLFALALVLALPTACGGPKPSEIDACPGWLRHAGPEEEQLPPDQGLARSVRRAYGIAFYYIGSWDKEAAWKAAWEAASVEAARLGVAHPAPIVAGLADYARTNAYTTAFQRLEDDTRDLPDAQRITDAALTAFANTFNDGHTSYQPEAFVRTQRDGKRVSSGLLVERHQGSFVITDVHPSSGAQRAGLSKGDIIVKTDPSSEDGSVRRVQVIRRSDGGAITELTLAAEPLLWLRSEMLNDSVGYVRLFEFSGYKSCEALIRIRSDLESALSQLRQQGAKAWIFDFRDNPGGRADTAAVVAAQLGFDGLLMRMRYNNNTQETFDIVSEDALGKDPLVILVNGRSASSSEIVAFALQETKRAHVIGVQSRGAVVSSITFPVSKGAFSITGAFVDVGPDRKNIDKIGVTPDTKIALDLELLRVEGRDSQLEAATSYLRQKLGR